jgi:uncharacterized protein (DUF952 family)
MVSKDFLMVDVDKGAERNSVEIELPRTDRKGGWGQFFHLFRPLQLHDGYGARPVDTEKKG